MPTVVLTIRFISDMISTNFAPVILQTPVTLNFSFQYHFSNTFDPKKKITKIPVNLHLDCLVFFIIHNAQATLHDDQYLVFVLCNAQATLHDDQYLGFVLCRVTGVFRRTFSTNLSGSIGG